MDKVINYLKNRVGIEIMMLNKNKIKINKLPFHLKKGYEIQPVILQGKKVVLVKPNNHEYPAPNQLKQQLGQIEKSLQMQGILVLTKINSYSRKRMIINRTPFVVEDKQVFIPFMFLDLNERKEDENDEKEYLSPSSQCILIFHLLNRSLGDYNLTAISKLLSYSQMTISRSVNELEKFGLCEVVRGKDKKIVFDTDKYQLWLKAKSFMKTPIKKKIWIENDPINQSLLLTGITALSLYTNISRDKTNTYAITTDVYKQLKENQQLIGENKRYGSTSIEIWKYDPSILSNKNTVDPISLFLSMNNDDDERIQQAIEQMINDLW